MFARSVSFHLKPGRSAEFTQLFDTQIVPMLRKQTGFKDEIAFLAPGAEGRSIGKICRTNARRRHLGIDPGCSRQRLGRGLWHVALEARIDCAKPNPIARMQGDFTGPDSVNSCPVSRSKIAELVRLVGPTQFRMPA